MQNQKRNQQLDNSLSLIRSLKQTLDVSSICVGHLENLIISLSSQTDSESSSHQNTCFMEVYRNFLVIAKLLRILLALKSQIGIKGLTCCMSLSNQVTGKNWEIQDTPGELTDSELFPINLALRAEQLEVDLYPVTPQ